MKRIVCGRWGNTVKDRSAATIAADEKAGHGFPATERFPEDVVGLMSGKVFLVLDEKLNFVSMVREYVSHIQAKYCCGKCLTGIKGTKMLLLTLDRIIEGRGEESDLALLERVAHILDEAAKCSVCQSCGRIGERRFESISPESFQRGGLRRGEDPSGMWRDFGPAHDHLSVSSRSAYVEMLQEVRYSDSLRSFAIEMPLPGITGRVSSCRRAKACTLANMGKSPSPSKPSNGLRPTMNSPTDSASLPRENCQASRSL
jgi:hypothetical protein